MKNIIYSLIICYTLLIGCHEDNISEIILKTKGFPDSTLIYLTDIDAETIDSGYITNNVLAFHVKKNELTYYCIYPVIKTRDEIDYRYFWKENRKVTIKAMKGDLKSSFVKGSKIQNLEDKIALKTQILNKEVQSILEQQRYINNDEKGKLQQLSLLRDSLENAIIDINVHFIRDNPSELYSAIILKNLMKYSLSKETTRALYLNLTEKIRNSTYGLMVKNYLDLQSLKKIGDKATDFKLPDINGNIISLSNLRGKYVLLDFWYSGCGPCRIANPIMLKYYHTYREKGFEIIGISCDKNKDVWRSTIIKDQITWPTVSDLKGTNSDVVLAYNIKSFPTYYLIDPHGIIIDIIIGNENLNDKLKGLMNH